LSRTWWYGATRCVRGHPELGGVCAAGLQSFDFLEECFEVHHAAVADDGNRVGAENACRQQLEFVLFTAYDDGVPGVVAAVGLDDVVNAAAQKVSGLAFSFVAPLGSYDHNCWHGILPHSFGLSGPCQEMAGLAQRRS
jgi:hypothetical protein